MLALVHLSEEYRARFFLEEALSMDTVSPSFSRGTAELLLPLSPVKTANN